MEYDATVDERCVVSSADSFTRMDLMKQRSVFPVSPFLLSRLSHFHFVLFFSDSFDSPSLKAKINDINRSLFNICICVQILVFFLLFHLVKQNEVLAFLFPGNKVQQMRLSKQTTSFYRKRFRNCYPQRHFDVDMLLTFLFRRVIHSE